MAELLQRLTAARGHFAVEANAIALQDATRQISWAELTTAIEATADALNALSIKRLALVADNSVDWVLVDLAAQQAGIVLIPLPSFFTPAQAAHSVAAVGVDYLLADQLPPSWAIALCITERTNLPLRGTDRLTGYTLAPTTPRPALPEQCQKITFTSGSTGEPKGVCLSTAHQWQVAESLAGAIGLARPRHLGLLPLATLLENIAGVYTPLLCGGTVVLATGCERGISGSSGVVAEQLLTAITGHRPNSLILIPALLTLLVAATEQGWAPPDTLRFIAVGGARTAPDLLAAATRRGLPVYEGYGLSECGSVVALNCPSAHLAGSAGKILTHCRVRIQRGELIIERPCFLGYVGDRASWGTQSVASGDLASLDRQGFLTIAGRSKNLLITSFGRNVSPEWVESLLLGGTLLRRCVVVGDGQPHLTALIDDQPSLPDTAVRAWFEQCNLHLPDYAQVHHWLRLTESQWQPLMTANGRPRRTPIQTLFASLTSTESPL